MDEWNKFKSVFPTINVPYHVVNFRGILPYKIASNL